MRMCPLVVASLALALPAVGRAQEPSVLATSPTVARPADTELWPTGHSGIGTGGIHRVQGAYAPRAGDILLVLAGEYSLASDLFEDGDQNERYGQHVTVVWSPIQNLELLLRQSTVSNRNDAFEPATTQVLGDPDLGLKYSYRLGRRFGAAAGLIITLPTSSKGTGLKPEAVVLHAYGAFSYLPATWLSVSVNAGYRYDRSNQVFQRALLPVQRFAAGLNGLQGEQVDQVVAGLGVDTSFSLGEQMAIGPFAEVTSAIPIGADFDNGPLRATLGAKFSPFGQEAVEVAIGGDYAILGTPTADGKMAGVPPWEGFVRVIAHLGPKPAAAPVTTRAGPPTCDADGDCTGADMVCTEEKLCAKQVIRQVVEEVEKPTFTIEGGVFDQASGDPIGAATVSISGFHGTSLAVDYESGNFKSWPIPVGDGLVKVTAVAPSCAAAEQAIKKGDAGERIPIAFKLQCGELTGEIKGSLKDARTGKAVKNGQVFVPILSQKIKTDREGKFSATVKAGRYQVLISARRYVTQKKEIEIRAGDIVILNVGMNRR
jgi:hypothetical protein